MIWGLGCQPNGIDLKMYFLKNNIATLGYRRNEALSLHQAMERADAGDIIYLKKFSPTRRTLSIVGVGLVNTNNPQLVEYTDADTGQCLGFGKKVKWVFKGEHDLDPTVCKDKQRNVRTGSFYVEFSGIIKRTVIRLLTENLK